MTGLLWWISWNLKEQSPQAKRRYFIKMTWFAAAVGSLKESESLEKMQNLENLTFEIATMGCKVNTYDTSLLEQKLVSAGFKGAKAGAAGSTHVHIINSCAVTE